MFKADDNGEIIYFQSTGQLVAQMYEAEGMRQFTHANVTAVLTKKGASSGNIIIIILNLMCVHPCVYYNIKPFLQKCVLHEHHQSK